MKITPLVLAFFALAAQALQPLPVCASTPPVQVADLHSFFHGDPPPVPKAPPPKQLAVVTFAPGVVPDAQIDAFFRAMADAIMVREGKPMLSRLSNQYSVDDLPSGRKAGDFFVQAMERIAGPAAIAVQSIETIGTVRNARVELRYADSPGKARLFRFDAAGRLLWSDLFRLQAKQAGG